MSLKFAIFVAQFASLSAFAMGGISGGGGNVLPGRPPEYGQDPEVVEHEIGHSRGLALEYLQDSQGDSSPLLNVAEYVRPEIRDDRPCYDAQGQAVDGSIWSNRPNTFCISALNLSRKVHPSELRAQAAALMIHEYAELAGASEDQAVQLQTEAFHKFESRAASPRESSD